MTDRPDSPIPPQFEECTCALSPLLAAPHMEPIIEEPEDSHVRLEPVTFQISDDPSGLLGPPFAGRDNRVANINAKITLMRSFVKSKPEKRDTPIDIYGPNARVQCDNCYDTCTSCHWHGKVVDANFDLCHPCAVMSFNLTNRHEVADNYHELKANIAINLAYPPNQTMARNQQCYCCAEVFSHGPAFRDRSRAPVCPNCWETLRFLAFPVMPPGYGKQLASVVSEGEDSDGDISGMTPQQVSKRAHELYALRQARMDAEEDARDSTK